MPRRPPPPSRPIVKPALRLLWRDHTTVQLGIDPRHALVLTGADGTAAGLLALLDGTRDHAAVIADAAQRGIDRATAEMTLDLLAGAGALDEAGADTSPVAGLSRVRRDRLAPDLASLSLLHPAPARALAVLGRRRAAAVTVVGAARVGAPTAALLAAAGVGRVSVHDRATARAADAALGGLAAGDAGLPRAQALAERLRPAEIDVDPSPGGGPGGRPALVVLAPAGPLDQAGIDDLVRQDVTHLVVRLRETTGIVGPLVVPGRTSCLRCADLHRADRDASWPTVAAQLATPRRGGVEPCDTVLAAAVAAQAAQQALTYLERGPDDSLPASADGTLELALPDWRWRRRSWAPHPGCGCGWPAAG